MDVLGIAAIGIVIVLASILLLRLHPLIALLLGSLFLLAATPDSVRMQQQLADEIQPVSRLSGGLIGLPRMVPSGDYYLWDARDSMMDATRVQLLRASPGDLASTERTHGLGATNLAWYRVVGASTGLSTTKRLVSTTAVAKIDGSRWSGLGKKLANGFTKTFRKLGIPVTMAAIVGICLLESGAAARLVGAIVRLFGARATAPALTFSGFVLGIPVFFDNVFYLLLPLAKAFGRTNPRAYLTAVMAIIVGATMAHSLVPPTPGPLLVAAAINVSVGTMMIGGLVVGSCAAIVGFTYGAICHRWVHLRPEAAREAAIERPAAESDSDPQRPVPLWIAALPIAIPIAALGGSQFVAFLAEGHEPSSRIVRLNQWASLCNDPNLIFLGTAIFSVALLRYYTSRQLVANSMARGLSDAGTIVLLTCAGGAFGASLQQLQLADAIGNNFAAFTTPWGLLVTAFLLTTIVRAAQGSATVAMITSAAIVGPVMESIPLPFHPVYVALAIGCGSKPLPWMNDSGFWQVATMTGMTPGQTLRTFSVALTLMGVTGFLVTLIGAWCIPLV